MERIAVGLVGFESLKGYSTSWQATLLRPASCLSDALDIAIRCGSEQLGLVHCSELFRVGRSRYAPSQPQQQTRKANASRTTLLSRADGPTVIRIRNGGAEDKRNAAHGHLRQPTVRSRRRFPRAGSFASLPTRALRIPIPRAWTAATNPLRIRDETVLLAVPIDVVATNLVVGVDAGDRRAVDRVGLINRLPNLTGLRKAEKVAVRLA
jgi:hypothetical protein